MVVIRMASTSNTSRDDVDTDPHAMGGPSAPPPDWVLEGWTRAKAQRDEHRPA